MGELLLLILLFELFVFYLGNGKNVISPSFIGCAMFVFSTIMYLSADDFYGYELHLKTVFVIPSLLIFIFLGENFARIFKIKEEKADRKEKNRYLNINGVLILLFSVFVLTISLSYFNIMYQYSLEVGNTPGNFETMAKFTREAVLSGKYDPVKIPTLISQGTVLSECLVWFSIYCLICNKNATGKFQFRFLLPVFCFLPTIYAMDNRSTLMKMIAVSFVIIFVLVKEKQGWSAKGNLKIILIAGLVLFGYIMLFRMLGYRTEASLRNEFSDSVTEYTSAGLVGLDKYLEKGEVANTIFGESTLKSVYAILRQWGLSIPEVEKFEPFYTFFRGKSNIYTTFKAYIHDYGFLGASLSMFLWGFIISYNVKVVRKNGAGFVRMVILGLMFYGVAMLSIADITGSILAMGTVYTLFYLYLIDYVFIKGKVKLA